MNAQRPVHRRRAIVVALAAFGLFAMLATLVASGAADAFDADIMQSLHRTLQPLQPFLGTMRAISRLGSALVLLSLCAVASLGLWLFGRRRDAFTLVLALGATMAVNTALKATFQRARPEPLYDDILGTFSFPSGHSAFACSFYLSAAAVAATCVTRPAWKATIFAVAATLIAAIGFSRVYLGHHHPTDVVAGFLVAIAMVAMVRIGEEGRIPRNREGPSGPFNHP